MKRIFRKVAGQFLFPWMLCAFIGALCFFLPASADTLKLPENLRIVEEEAFCGNTSLDEVYLPDGLLEIGRRAFAECRMNSIRLPESITFIDDTAFEDASFQLIYASPGSYAFDWMVRHQFIRPKISAYSDDEIVVSGDTVTLHSEASATSGNVFYQWQQSADGMTWSNTEFNENNEESLTFRAGADTLKYFYRCCIQDNNGDWYSNPVSVQLAPRIEASADHKTALQGETVVLSVTVTDEQGICTYQWQYGIDGENWYDVTTLVEADQSMLPLYSSEHNLQYLYRCAVTDDHGVWYSNPVQVTFSPLRIISNPWSQTAVVDERVYLSVEADGYEPLTYQWQVRFPEETDWRDSVTGGNDTPQLFFDPKDYHNGVQYRCRVTNGYGDSLYSEPAVVTVTPRPVYRAVMFAMGNFLRQDSSPPADHDYFIYYGYEEPYFYVESINRNYGSAQLMCRMLDHVYGGKTSDKYSFKWFKDMNYNDIEMIIQQEFADTTEYDVSLFFIATHGYSNGDGDLEMPFQGSLNQADIDYYRRGKTGLSFDTLASWLKKYVKGEVIVILQSCGAGSAIYSTADSENATLAKRSTDDGADFVSRAIASFAKADEINQSRRDASPNATGGLRINKFYVLAASRHHELSYGNEDKQYNYFVKWLTDGVGTSGNMPADTDHNGIVDLTELFTYINQYSTYQHVQRYPTGSRYPLFR